MTLSTWLRVIRIKFLLASVIAVSLGIAISWWNTASINFFHAALTMAGVVALHASVDLFNDYWDFKRGIDTQTKRTKLSGGTGVLPEGLLEPSQVYRAGLIFLIIGSIIGAFFIYEFGIIIAILLGFAILSIYFYSTKIVNYGLAEVFVTVKGTMIVLGTYFIQTSHIHENSVLGGVIVGILSALVLFITSFPDHDADKSKGRKTLVIAAGKEKSSKLFWIFPFLTFLFIVTGIYFGLFPEYCLLALFSIPLIIKSGLQLQKNFNEIEDLEPIMKSTLTFSRLTGTLFIIGFLVSV